MVFRKDTAKGLPRTDVMLNGDRNTIAKKIKSCLSINEDNKILLYAPTFRADMELPNTHCHPVKYWQNWKTVQAISGHLSFICIQMFITPNTGWGIQKK